MSPATDAAWREFGRRRDGLLHAISGGLWLHRFTLGGRPMAHLVSSDQDRLLAWGREAGLDVRWIQYKPLKDPRTGVRVPMWHWDLWGDLLPPAGGSEDQAGAGGGVAPLPRR